MNKKKFTTVFVAGMMALGLGLSLNAQYSLKSREALAERIEEAFSKKDVAQIKVSIEDSGKDPLSAQNPAVFDALTSLYPKVNALEAQQKDAVFIKKGLIDRIASSKRPEVSGILSRIIKEEKNPEVRHYAIESLKYLEGQPLNERIDTSNYIMINGKTMTYDEAYSVLQTQLGSSDINQKLEAIQNFGLFGNKLNGDPIIQQLIDLYEATPSPPLKSDAHTLTEEQRNQVKIKYLVLYAVAGSGDSKRGALLREAEADPSPIIRGSVQDIKKWTIEVGELLPGGIPKRPWKPSGVPKASKVSFLGKMVTSSGATSEAAKIFLGSDVVAMKKAVDYLRRHPQDVRDTKLFDVMATRFNTIDRLRQPGNTLAAVKLRDDIRFIKEGILIVLADSGDSRTTAFLETVQKRAEPSMKEIAADILKTKAAASN